MDKEIIIRDLIPDIKNALNSISGFAELLDNQLNEVKQKEMMANLKLSLITITKQIRILDECLWDEKESAGLEFDFRELLINYLTQKKKESAKRNIDLEFYIENDIPLFMFEQMTQIWEIIDNLLEWVLSISDGPQIDFNVVGIQKEEGVEFEILFKSERTREIKDKYGIKNYLRRLTCCQREIDSGVLGMSIAVDIIEQNGYAIEIENFEDGYKRIVLKCWASEDVKV